MMVFRKTIVLLSFALVASTLCVYGINNHFLLDTFAISEYVWKHYSAIEPTNNRHGSVEFWANCTVHGYSLDCPSEGTIVEGGPFDETIYFYELDRNDSRYIKCLDEQRGIVPSFKDNDTITYGMYPQTVVSDYSIIHSLDAIKDFDANGYVLFAENLYKKIEISKVVRFDSENDPTFKNGHSISYNSSYWFKVEPIEWTILSSDNGEYKVISKTVLDTEIYTEANDIRIIDGKTIYPSNYEHSYIRDWLNNDFYNKAFCFNDEYIIPSNIDDGIEKLPVDWPDYQYNFSLPSEKIYIPDIDDIFGKYYRGDEEIDDIFATACGASDYSYVKGEVNFFVNPDACMYWGRTACLDNFVAGWTTGSFYDVNDVFGDSFVVNGVSKKISATGVRPMTTIKIS